MNEFDSHKYYLQVRGFQIPDKSWSFEILPLDGELTWPQSRHRFEEGSELIYQSKHALLEQTLSAVVGGFSRSLPSKLEKILRSFSRSLPSKLEKVWPRVLAIENEHLKSPRNNADGVNYNSGYGSGGIYGSSYVGFGSHGSSGLYRNSMYIGGYGGLYGGGGGGVCMVVEECLIVGLEEVLEMIMFSSEVPSRFGISCLGSLFLAGSQELAELLKTAVNGQNVSFTDAAKFVGYAITKDLSSVFLQKGSYSAFVELHIEQGLILEEEEISIGVVTTIAAPAGIKVDFEGNGGHAGSVLMPKRNDAGLAAAEFALAVEKHVLESGSIDKISIGVVTAIAAPASIKVDFEGNGGHAGSVLMPKRIWIDRHCWNSWYPRKISLKLLAVASVCGVEMSSNNGSSLQISWPNSRFLLDGPQKIQSMRRISVKSAESQSGLTLGGLQSTVLKLLHLLVSLGIILATDKFLKNAFAAAAIKFPSALFGMFCIFTILMVLDSTVPDAAITLMNFFQPALLFIQRWLPLIYEPSLVVLPLTLKDILASSGLKILCIIVGGWLASLSVAGFTTIAMRKMVNTEMIPAEPMPKPSPFSSIELWTWSGIFLISFLSSLLYPTLLGTNARACLPFLLASTVVGYIFGSGLPSAVNKDSILPKIHQILELVTFLWGFLDQLFSHLPSQCSNRER
ncbi:hypothetical protein ACS0TY_005892 [Phlomoides rotata]